MLNKKAQPLTQQQQKQKFNKLLAKNYSLTILFRRSPVGQDGRGQRPSPVPSGVAQPPPTAAISTQFTRGHGSAPAVSRVDRQRRQQLFTTQNTHVSVESTTTTATGSGRVPRIFSGTLSGSFRVPHLHVLTEKSFIVFPV